MPNKSIHAFISGRVQGVYYRQSTREKAQALGLTGWVRNLTDGRVELMASGEVSKVEAFIKWLWQGPPWAEVNNVAVSEIENPQLTDFAIKK